MLHPNHWTARKVPDEHYFSRGEKKRDDLKVEFSVIIAVNGMSEQGAGGVRKKRSIRPGRAGEKAPQG